MAVVQRRMTADEVLALPPDNSKDQLIDGEIVESEARLRHQRILVHLAPVLADWLDQHPGTGEAGFGCNWRMEDFNVFIPDVWFMAETALADRLWFDGPPDLVVEVRSPSTWHYDVGRKRELNLAGGSQVWLVDTESSTVLAFRRNDALEVGAGEQLTTPLLPGLAVDATELFDR
jgi:Uma2 family endonuclease